MSSAYLAGAALANIARTAPAARAVAYRQTARAHGGAGSSKPGSRMPIDLPAAAGLDAVLVRLTRWAGQPAGPGEPITELAVRMMGWPVVADWTDDVLTSDRILVSIASGPETTRYLGGCDRCQADLYALEGAAMVMCRPCGMEYAQADRVALLAREVRSHAFRASLISSAYGIKVGTIRSWASRGKLAARGRDRDGRPLFVLADVLALAGHA